MILLHRDNLTRHVIQLIFDKHTDDDIDKYVGSVNLLLMRDCLLNSVSTESGFNNDVSAAQVRKLLNTLPNSAVKPKTRLSMKSGSLSSDILGGLYCTETLADEIIVGVFASKESDKELVLTITKGNDVVVCGTFSAYCRAENGYKIFDNNSMVSADGTYCLSFEVCVDTNITSVSHVRKIAAKIYPNGTIDIQSVSNWIGNDRMTESLKQSDIPVGKILAARTLVSNIGIVLYESAEYKNSTLVLTISKDNKKLYTMNFDTCIFANKGYAICNLSSGKSSKGVYCLSFAIEAVDESVDIPHSSEMAFRIHTDDTVELVRRNQWSNEEFGSYYEFDAEADDLVLRTFE